MNCISRIVALVAVVVLFFTAGIAGVSAADAASAVLGEDITLHGTNPLGGPVYFYIKGPNFPLTQMKEDGDKLAAYGKRWEITIDTSKIKSDSGKRPDIGTYTIYISVTDGAASVNDFDSSFTTVPLSLTAPGIYIQTAAPTPEKTAEPAPAPTPSVPPTSDETSAASTPGFIAAAVLAGVFGTGFLMRKRE